MFGTQALVIEDTAADTRTLDHPLVTGQPHARAYAGHPITLSTGEVIGTLCGIDTTPRAFSERQVTHLRLLAEQAASLIESRREHARTPEFQRGGASGTARAPHAFSFVTDRAAVASSPERSEETDLALLGAAFDRFPEPALIADRDGTVVGLNPAADALLDDQGTGAQSGDTLELVSTRLIGATDLSRLFADATRGEPCNTRFPIPGTPTNPRSQGPDSPVSALPQRWLDVSATPILDDSSVVTHVLIVARDVSGEVERELDARLRAEGAEARARISSILSGAEPIGDRFRAALEAVLDMDQLNVQKKACLLTLDEGDEYLRMHTHVGGFTHEFLQNESQVKIGSCLCGQAALTGELVVSDNCLEDSRYVCSWPGMSAHGRYVLPLMDSGRCVGVLFLCTDVNPSRSEARLEALRQIGQLFANTIVSDRISSLINATTRRLQEAQVRFELALEGSRDAIFDWDIPAGQVYYSARWAELLRCEEHEIAPTIRTLFFHVAPEHAARVEEELFRFVDEGDDHCEIEFRLLADDGTSVWVLFRAAAIREQNGRAVRVTGAVADISKMKTAEEKVRRMVQQDQLTGLASRSRLMERLDSAVRDAQRTGESCALLFFDFDRFKVVNDSLGHDVGDELLCSIANRLRSAIRANDLAARLGGDEFVILLEDIQDSDAARATADKLLQSCAVPHVVRGHRLVSTASIGLVTTEHSSGSAAEMLRDADAAMYAAKASGRGCVVEFDKAMHDASLDRLALEEDLRSALEGRAFELHYQPIVNLETGSTIGAEALLRWTHPLRGSISPAVFIPIAEESNLIRDIGWWVVDEACAQVLDWKTRDVMPRGFRLSINVSKAQLLCPEFVDRLTERLKNHGLEPVDLKLEVTETTIVDNRAGVSSVLDELRSRGFTVMMDDFGTGHSSLSGLHTLPIDELKIDQSFIRHENASRDIIAITSSIVTLADHLRLRTVGEGIESVQQIALLQNLGCHYGQGYYFSRPVPAPELERWMHEQNRERAA